MRVLVTGGTGFVGSHTVAALLRNGHEVRLFVRDPNRVRLSLDPLGAGEVEVVSGDVTEPQSIRTAMVDCDAVVHAGSVYTLDSRRAAEVRLTNVTGTDHVIHEAVEAGLDPIVHVSSIAALYGRWGVLTPDTEPSVFPGPYIESKAASDRIARGYQAEGAPVVITYPGTVWGPHDPYIGESSQIALRVLKGALRFAIHGGLVVTDVRDLAALHNAVLEPGQGPRRYFAPGTLLELRALVRRLAVITERELKCTIVPTMFATGQVRLMSLLQRVLPIRAPLSEEGLRAVVAFNRIDGWDASRTEEELGIVGRDVNESLHDTAQWLYEQGLTSAARVGRLAEISKRGDDIRTA